MLGITPMQTDAWNYSVLVSIFMNLSLCTGYVKNPDHLRCVLDTTQYDVCYGLYSDIAVNTFSFQVPGSVQTNHPNCQKVNSNPL